MAVKNGTTRAPATKSPARRASTKKDTQVEVAAPAAKKTGLSRTGVKLAITLMLMAFIGAAAGFGTWSAFSSTTSNSGNTFQTGTVVIGDNDSNGSMLSLSNAKPGDTSTSCITVNFTGSLASNVHLYGTTTGSGLDQFLNLTITRGSGAAGFNNCTGFTPDAGGGVIYNGTLQAFPATYAAGVVDPTAAWVNGDSHQYRIAVSVQDNNAAQGLNAATTFDWEARNN